MLQAVVWFIIAVLLVTGGYRGKIELSQLNVFGWVALVLGLIQWRKTGRFFDRRLEKIGRRLFNAVKSHPKRTIGIAFAAHVLLFTLIQLNCYRSFEMNAFDIGFLDQAIWSVAHGKGGIFLHSDLSRGLHSYLSEHFAVILALLAPLYLIWDSIHWLFLVQSLLLGSGAIIIYRLARHHKLEAPKALLLAGAFLFYQPLRAANTFNLREDNFFIPILLGAILTMEKRQWMLFWVLSALSLLVKENAPLVLLALAAWLAIRGERRQAAVLSVFAATAFWIINSKVMPYYSGGGSSTVLSSRLGPLGANFGEIVRNLMFHPLDSAAKIYQARVSLRTFKYLLTVALPFIPFLAIRPWRDGFAYVIGFGFLLLNLLVMDQTVGFHYECVLMPFLFAGLVHGFARRSRQYGAANAAALLGTLMLCVYGRSPILTLREWWPTKDHKCMSRALEYIPGDASIMAQGGLYPHLDHRDVTQTVSYVSLAKEDFVLLSRLKNVSEYPIMDRQAQIDAMFKLPAYKLIVDGPLLSIWCRREACAKYPQAVAALGAEQCLK